ncbi:aldehyde dehydrogenase [Carex littledalei]|uniref:Aldehyde dehydrogenase n=1 Tax=Carex littledalei TaxID=544730 RepID=A0A833R1N2_9POAL|nr:aldehyde dehydrogenase [Carex littledalei]
MDALRKHANKLKEQVSKQQQAVIKQFSGSGYEGSDVMAIDELEETPSVRETIQVFSIRKVTELSHKDFQKDIARAGEAFVLLGNRHIEIGTKLSEDCFRYGSENTANNAILAKVACLYGGALRNIEKEYEEFNHILSNQVSITSLPILLPWSKSFERTKSNRLYALGCAPLISRPAWMKKVLRLLHECGLPLEDADIINFDGVAMKKLLLEAKPNMTLFTGSSRAAEKLAADLKGRSKLEDAGFDWKILRKKDLIAPAVDPYIYDSA